LFESNHSGIETQATPREGGTRCWFESNHSGIETSITFKYFNTTPTMFESNHSGIETYFPRIDFKPLRRGLNRTIVELRHLSVGL